MESGDSMASNATNGPRPSVTAANMGGRTTSTPRRQTAAEKLAHLTNQRDLDLLVRILFAAAGLAQRIRCLPLPGLVCSTAREADRRSWLAVLAVGVDSPLGRPSACGHEPDMPTPGAVEVASDGSTGGAHCPFGL